jgi:hypothetical protein
MRDIKTVLEQLGKSIEEQLTEPESEQLSLWKPEEKLQLERNMSSLQARLEAIPYEIEKETAAIGARYENPVERTFPVAIAILVPERFSGDSS